MKTIKTYKITISASNKTEVRQTADLIRSMSGVDVVEIKKTQKMVNEKYYYQQDAFSGTGTAE